MTLNRLLKPLLNFVFSPDKEGSMSHLDSVRFYLHKDLLEHYANIAILPGLIQHISLDCVH